MSPISAPSGNAMASMMSPHRDVLDAEIPSSDEGKQRLYQECKSRATAAVKAQSWKDAEMLYEKGLKVCPSTKDEAILHANMSLCQRNMHGYDSALTNAELAVEKDNTYLKGYWRLGQVLTDLERKSDALEAYEKALKLDPSNKAIKKECSKLKEQIEEERKLMEQQLETEEPESMEIDNNDKKTTATTDKVKKSAPKAETTTTTKKSSTNVVKEDGDDEFTKSDHVKGYQIVNGKKTTFFHNELSEEAKQLIGDITPKRLDDPSLSSNGTPQPIKTTDPTEKGTSAWNKAGTWEERDVTSWAVDTLKASLLSTTYTLPESCPDPGSVASIIEVKKCDGHASYASVRGKKRYIYEFLVEIKFQIELKKYGTTVTGSMTFPDVDGTCELGDGYDMVHYTVSSDTPNDVRPLLDQFIKNDGLRSSIHNAIDDWVRLFRSTY